MLVPNSELATNAITHLTNQNPQALTHEFGIDYDEDVGRTTELITGAAKSLSRVRGVPAPSVEVLALEVTSVVLTTKIWIDRQDRSQRMAVHSEFLRQVHERCRAAGIDLSETSQHELAGAVTLADGDAVERASSGESA